VNSINFARIAAQCVYYFTAAARFPAPAVFVVPTGNFGDVFAGEAAMHMGLDIERLVIATNANDILWRALDEGVYSVGQRKHALSPSMDIQVASNFERALFEASGRDAAWIRCAMEDFAGIASSVSRTNVSRADLRARYSARAATTRKRSKQWPRLSRDGPVHRSAYGRGPHGGAGKVRARKGRHCPFDGTSRQVSRCGAQGYRDSAPPCPRALPTFMRGRSV
jgi:hypothetical protein